MHLDRRRAGRPLRFHYDLLGDGSVIYVYIYKNACSVFKKMLVDTVAHQAPASALEAMRLREVTRNQATHAQFRFFVARNPADRVISGFLNQVATKVGRSYPEMFNYIEAATGKQIHQITFSDFIKNYIATANWQRINAHFWPMENFLCDIFYDAVIDMSRLHESATQLFGASLADRYFVKKVNSTSTLLSDDFFDYSDVTVDEIFRLYKKTRRYPPKKCFMRSDVLEILYAVYENDFRIYELARDSEYPPSLDFRNKNHAAK